MDSQLSNVKEIIFLIEKDRYIIGKTKIDHYEGKELLKLKSKSEVSIKEFEEIGRIVLENTQNWKKEYLNKNLENKRWSIVIKYNDETFEEYSGYDKFPKEWDSFMEKIILLIEKSDTLEEDSIYISLVINYMIGMGDFKISNCGNYIYSFELFKSLNVEIEGNQATSVFEKLSPIQYLKMLVESKKIVELYSKKYQEKEAESTKKLENIIKNMQEILNKYKNMGVLDIEKTGDKGAMTEIEKLRIITYTGS